MLFSCDLWLTQQAVLCHCHCAADVQRTSSYDFQFQGHVSDQLSKTIPAHFPLSFVFKGEQAGSFARAPLWRTRSSFRVTCEHHHLTRPFSQCEPLDGILVQVKSEQVLML